MTDAGETVAGQYGRGGLIDRIAAGIDQLGLSRSGLPLTALATVDEFHTGGLPATLDLFRQLDVVQGAAVLDIGCGIGGPARHLAVLTGASVTGIDLSADFIAVGRALTEWCGLADRVTLIEADALAMPFAARSFDLAYMLHVGMNIPDKAGLAAETARVLRPGGPLAIYDIMRVGEAALEFPLPWASQPGISAVATPCEYRAALAAAGFECVSETDRSADALSFFAAAAAKAATASRPSPLGVDLVMGPEAPRMVANLQAAIQGGIVAPVVLIARKG